MLSQTAGAVLSAVRSRVRSHVSFRPNMQAFVSGIAPVEELRFLELDGIVADLWHVESIPGATGRYLSPDPRLTVVLDPAKLAVSCDEDAAMLARTAVVSYVPAGQVVWGRVPAARRFRHLDLHFDVRRLATLVDIPAARLTRPVFLDQSPRIVTLAELIAEQCIRADRPEGYVDALIRALLAELFAAGAEGGGTTLSGRGGLTPAQLARVTRHIEANLAARIPIEDLAAVAGLSPSWFAHAFKTSTGLPPGRWQMRARIDRAAALLTDGQPPAAVAAEAGFADQAHLTRAFRAARGITPAAFRRQKAIPAGF